MIPGNLQKYVSTNRSLFQSETLPGNFSNNMMVYCLFKSKMNGGCAFRRAQNSILNVCDPYNRKF